MNNCFSGESLDSFALTVGFCQYIFFYAGHKRHISEGNSVTVVRPVGSVFISNLLRWGEKGRESSS